MNERYKGLITKSVWVVIILFVVRCAISWDSIIAEFSIYDIFGYAGEAIGIAAIIICFYEKILWKINPIEDTPVLKKQYEGTLTSTYDGVERKARLEIKQTLLSIHITLITDESRSKSISSSIDKILEEDQLTYCYLNTPQASVRERSEIHFGTAMLCIQKTKELTGSYFTDRKTTGDMNFSPKKRRHKNK